MSGLVFLQSHSGMGGALARATEARGGRVLRQSALTEADLATAQGLVTTMHLDQVGLMALAPALEAFLARGGRWFFNGHMMRRFVPGLGIYQPLVKPGRTGLQLTALAEHPVFAGIDREEMSTRKGVSGFYGRGHNPLPGGATAVTGVGPDLKPVDWDWALPSGGRIFSHAGNDLPGNAEGAGAVARLADNVIAWTMAEEREPA